ncbi:MAG: vWA domain-containing protein [Chthonomonadales bacterium]
MNRFLIYLSTFWESISRTVKPLFALIRDIFNAFFGRSGQKTTIRPWMIVRRTKKRAVTREAVASEADIRRMMERMHDLNDSANLADRAVRFSGSDQDFFGKPEEIEAMVMELLRQNPPFLHIARELPSDAEGDQSEVQTEYIVRDSVVTVTEPCTLFVPETGSEYRESRRPPGYPVLRPARSLSDLRFAPMLYNSLPQDLVFARLLDGSIPIMAYREDRKTILFRQEEHLFCHTEKRSCRVPIEVETGGVDKSTRLIYLLFDRSTSMVRNCAPRGINAVMELAIAVTMLRTDMGRPHARYYYRTFADVIDPKPKDPPYLATTLEEKDDLVRRIMNVNFSGDATRIVDALETAADDIEKIMESGELDPDVKPRIGLLTDGRSSLYGNIVSRLARLGIEVDTVLIGKEAFHNPELMKMSNTISMVDPDVYRANGRH